MRYLADILTFSRMGLSVALLVMIFTDAPIHAAFIVYMIGEITDALDGTCATHFPFPKNKIPRYRKYAAKYDMLADGMLAFAVVLFFTIRVSLITGIILFATYPLISTILEFIVYGKFLGHPDDCTKTSLMHRNFKLAKTIVLARRNVYLAIMFMIAVWMLYASEWSLLTKNIIMGIGIAGSLFFWIFLSTRRHNISRDAIDIEKELSKSKK
ncbi:CDP-alcohol phosphatidyltransferase family protein [Candidatus Saccharibacteria bacterium]|nr:CDP-alcohol phosphatidyltransferase family protein [Candidatus Saccharibacteria bacterium]